MMSSRTTRTTCITLGLVVSCLIGLPRLYDKFMIARFVAAATGLAFVFLFALVGRKRWRMPNTSVLLPYLLFLLLSGCSLLWATNTAEALFAFAVQLLGAFVILVTYTLLSAHKLSTQRALWVAAAIILTVYLTFAIIQLAHVERLSFEQLYHVGGINGHKNLLAAMLFVLSAFLLTAFTLFRSQVLRWGAMLLFVLSLAVIVLLKSRAVLLSVIVAAICFGVLYLTRKVNDAKRVNRRYRLTLVVSIVLVYAFLTIGLRWFAGHSVPHSSEKSEVETRMTSTSSLVERCLLWDKTYRIVDKHPIVGCGVGNWQIHFPDAGLDGLYRADYWNVSFTKPHNEYLGVLAETGYLGLLFYVVFLVALVVRACFALSATTSRRTFLQGAIVLSIFVGGSINSLFDFPNSRIEHLVWNAILVAMLLQVVAKGRQKTLNGSWGIVFLAITLMMLTLGGFRLSGERSAFMMQNTPSPFYTIDPVGLPLYWHQGKAEKSKGKPQAIESFRKAYRHAPYCKENLNDLGLAEYHSAHDPKKAEYYLKEAIRISPHYLYPYLNLAYLYLSEGEPQKAEEVANRIDFDAHKREVLKADAAYFEPYNTEAMRRKIDADYEAVGLLHRTIKEQLEK